MGMDGQKLKEKISTDLLYGVLKKPLLPQS